MIEGATTRSVVWFRGKDLRLADHGPLSEALARPGEVLCLFVLDPVFFALEKAQNLPHRIQFLLDSLKVLEAEVARLGSRLFILEGPCLQVVPQVAEVWKADRVLASRWSEPMGVLRDQKMHEALGRLRVAFTLLEGDTLQPPGTILTGAGRLSAGFTPFARNFEAQAVVGRPLPVPRALPPPPTDLGSIPTVSVPTLESLGLRRNPRLLSGGEPAAWERLRCFVSEGLLDYPEGRDHLDGQGTSRLSQDLKFGTLSPRSAWMAVGEAEDSAPESVRRFRLELLWREFAYHWLFTRPDLLSRPFRESFEGFPWRKDPVAFQRWAEGRTGFPVVDAAARQLRETGYVHNRARMIAASFLAKHLQVDYRQGEAHYMTWLTDGDWAINNMGWQWSAGCGCDAQPWFRVFNPVLQGQTYDPAGAYVKRFVPELAGLETLWIHQPWKAPASARRSLDYPAPMVDLSLAREAFLAATRKHLGDPA